MILQLAALQACRQDVVACMNCVLVERIIKVHFKAMKEP